MDADDGGALHRGPDRDAEIAAEVLSGPLLAGELLDETLPARSDEDTAELRELGDSPHERDVLLARRPEPNHRVEIEPLDGQNRRHRRQIQGDSPSRIGDSPREAIRKNEFGAAFCANTRHLGDRPSVDAVDDRDACGHGPLRRLRVIGVHAQGDSPSAGHRGQSLEDGLEAGPFLLPGEGDRPRAGRFAAEVDDGRAFLNEVLRTTDGLFGPVELSAVRKRVRRDVDDSHDLAH